MTDGMLLREAMSDPMLENYQVPLILITYLCRYTPNIFLVLIQYPALVV
jgi:hypothetical protein